MTSDGPSDTVKILPNFTMEFLDSIGASKNFKNVKYAYSIRNNVNINEK